MSAIYAPSELEIQALHGEEDQRRSSHQNSVQTPKDTPSQSLCSSYRGIDRSRPPLPLPEQQEFGAFRCESFADNGKKKKQEEKNRYQRRGVIQEEEQESSAGSYHLEGKQNFLSKILSTVANAGTV